METKTKPQRKPAATDVDELEWEDDCFDVIPESDEAPGSIEPLDFEVGGEAGGDVVSSMKQMMRSMQPSIWAWKRFPYVGKPSKALGTPIAQGKYLAVLLKGMAMAAVLSGRLYRIWVHQGRKPALKIQRNGNEALIKPNDMQNTAKGPKSGGKHEERHQHRKHEGYFQGWRAGSWWYDCGSGRKA